jgi:alpha-beta hydrolase superfamily lysophospholipase
MNRWVILNGTEGTFIGSGDTELFYRVYRPNTAPRAAVIGVHGLGDHSGGLHNLLKPLSEKGFIAYAYDLRGHGKSPGIRGHVQSWDFYREDLHMFRKLVESESPGIPLYTIVHSLGGVIGLDYVLNDREGISGIAPIAPAVSYEVSLFYKLFISIVSAIKSDYTLSLLSDLFSWFDGR